MAAKITIGDRVAYTRQFLTALGLGYSAAQARGVVTALQGWGKNDLATVAWDGGTASAVNTANLCKPRSVAFVE